MEMLLQHKTEFAVMIVRLIAGILFVMQGYDKIFRIQLKEAADASAHALRNLPFPAVLVKVIIVITSVGEFLGGAMLILGIWTVPATYGLLACLLPVTLAMSMKEPMWNLQQVAVRLALLVFLMLVPVTQHTISLDYILNVYGSHS